MRMQIIMLFTTLFYCFTIPIVTARASDSMFYPLTLYALQIVFMIMIITLQAVFMLTKFWEVFLYITT